MQKILRFPVLSTPAFFNSDQFNVMIQQNTQKQSNDFLNSVCSTVRVVCSLRDFPRLTNTWRNRRPKMPCFCFDCSNVSSKTVWHFWRTVKMRWDGVTRLFTEQWSYNLNWKKMASLAYCDTLTPAYYCTNHSHGSCLQSYTHSQQATQFKELSSNSNTFASVAAMGSAWWLWWVYRCLWLQVRFTHSLLSVQILKSTQKLCHIISTVSSPWGRDQMLNSELVGM